MNTDNYSASNGHWKSDFPAALLELITAIFLMATANSVFLYFFLPQMLIYQFLNGSSSFLNNCICKFRIDIIDQFKPKPNMIFYKYLNSDVIPSFEEVLVLMGNVYINLENLIATKQHLPELLCLHFPFPSSSTNALYFLN